MNECMLLRGVNKGMNGWMDTGVLCPQPAQESCVRQRQSLSPPCLQPPADVTHTWSNLAVKQASGGQNHCYTNRPGPNPEAQEAHAALQFPLLSSCPSLYSAANIRQGLAMTEWLTTRVRARSMRNGWPHPGCPSAPKEAS